MLGQLRPAVRVRTPASLWGGAEGGGETRGARAPSEHQSSAASVYTTGKPERIKKALTTKGQFGGGGGRKDRQRKEGEREFGRREGERERRRERWKRGRERGEVEKREGRKEEGREGPWEGERETRQKGET